MPEYDNTNSGVLFKQYEKKTETHPDYTGSLNVNGVDYWLNGWKKTSKGGANFLSLSIKKKQEVEERGDDSAKHETRLDDDEPINLDSIPF